MIPLILPPSTLMVCPVKYPERGESNQAAKLANSSDLPIRPTSVSAANRAIASASDMPSNSLTFRIRRFMAGVAWYPGASTLRVMPFEATSAESVFTNPTTAARSELDKTRAGEF